MSDKELNKKLQQAKAENDNKVKSKKDNDLLLELNNLQKAYKEQSEIAMKAQRDYINLKFDFDRFQKQTQEKEKDLELNSLILNVKKFLPFIENLRKSLDNLSQEQKSDPLIRWVQLLYDNFLKTLELMDIKQIKAIWMDPNSNLYEPISVQPVEDKKMKWKIIQEFERWFIYKKDNKEIILNTSKVVVGQ